MQDPGRAPCGLLPPPLATRVDARADPIAPDVLATHAESKRRCGARKVKASLERRSVVANRRQISQTMGENGLSSAYGKKHFKAHPGKPNEAELPNLIAREFDCRARVCSDLTYERVADSWCYACLPVDLCNREVIGHSAGARKDARLVKAALEFPVSDSKVFRTDRDGEFDNAEVNLMLEAFGVERPLSAKGYPYDNAVNESMNRILKAEFVYREVSSDLRDLQSKLSGYAR